MIKSTARFLKKLVMKGILSKPMGERAAFEIKHSHFELLDLHIPLSHGKACPIPHLDSFYSFSEIFVTREYEPVWAHMELPSRWLDFGCHTGYFSLYVNWLRACKGLAEGGTALLVDADPRMEDPVRRTLVTNHLEKSMIFRAGMIHAGEGSRSFSLRSGMGSSSDTEDLFAGEIRDVNVVTPAEILAAFPPPYDLIKMDIEGGEFDFMKSYEPVYRHAKAMVLEWHSPGAAGEREGELIKAVEKAGFCLKSIIQPKRTVSVEGRDISAGLHLYLR